MTISSVSFWWVGGLVGSRCSHELSRPANRRPSATSGGILFWSLSELIGASFWRGLRRCGAAFHQSIISILRQFISANGTVITNAGAPTLPIAGAGGPMGALFGAGGPPTATQWFEKGCDIKLWKIVDTPMPGDVASDGEHMGVVTSVTPGGGGTTASASTVTNTVVNNDWGFRPEQSGKIVFRRYYFSKCCTCPTTSTPTVPKSP